MTGAGTSSPALAPRSRRTGANSARARAARPQGPRPHAPRRRLGSYLDAKGRLREVIARRGSGGSVLVLDRDVATRGDRRLVAHLGADEPVANALLVCRHYLAGDPGGGPRCRALTRADAEAIPFPEDAHTRGRGDPRARARELAGTGHGFRLVALETGMSIPELRWEHRTAGRGEGRARVVSLREVVGSLEAYEPACGLTALELRAHAGSLELSLTVLRLELARVRESPIVLNRALREAVLAALARGELSMSEIAIRCGRVKRDPRGNESGETSWLGRRLGLLPEGGQRTPTPWIHSDVLGLIARNGLGLSPREVEV
jgi:hypothetical protein